MIQNKSKMRNSNIVQNTNTIQKTNMQSKIQIRSIKTRFKIALQYTVCNHTIQNREITLRIQSHRGEYPQS